MLYSVGVYPKEALDLWWCHVSSCTSVSFCLHAANSKRKGDGDSAEQQNGGSFTPIRAENWETRDPLPCWISSQQMPTHTLSLSHTNTHAHMHERPSQMYTCTLRMTCTWLPVVLATVESGRWDQRKQARPILWQMTRASGGGGGYQKMSSCAWWLLLLSLFTVIVWLHWQCSFLMGRSKGVCKATDAPVSQKVFMSDWPHSLEGNCCQLAQTYWCFH